MISGGMNDWYVGVFYLTYYIFFIRGQNASVASVKVRYDHSLIIHILITRNWVGKVNEIFGWEQIRINIIALCRQPSNNGF